MFKHRKYGAPSQATRRKHAIKDAVRTVQNWQEISVIDESTPERRVIARISSLQFGLIILVLASILTGYIGHIHTSQDLLKAINVQRRENIRLHLQHNRLVADYNASIGPSVIYERVQPLGLQRGTRFAGIIQRTQLIEP